MGKPKFLFSITKRGFDGCYGPDDQKELQSLVELVGGIPSKTEYTREWVLQNIKDVEACVTGWGSIQLDEEILDRAPELKILFHTAGTVRRLYAKARARGIRMVSNASVNAIPVAQFALGVILNSLKGVYRYQERFRRKGRLAWSPDKTISLGYHGTTVGIISLGHIGYKLADLLRNFEFNVLISSRHLGEEEAKRLRVRRADLDEVMSLSDAVVLCAPNLPKNRHMIDARCLALMKDNAIFINVSRGALVDEDALVKELRAERISAFLDVADPEPPEEGHPFYTMPNCLLTPHIAGSVGDECYRFGRAILNEIKHYLKGEPLKNELSSREFLYRA